MPMKSELMDMERMPARRFLWRGGSWANKANSRTIVQWTPLQKILE
jgi:hypothetical protein